jgi:hypothetical protein
MKLLISGFLKERVIPRLESTESRVKALQASLSTSPSGLPGAVSASLRLRSQTQVSALSPASLSAARFRLNRLAKWHRSARTILPLARKILGGS